MGEVDAADVKGRLERALAGGDTPATDALLEFVPVWIRDVFGPVSTSLDLWNEVHGSIPVLLCGVAEERLEKVVLRCAIGIAGRRLAHRPPLFFAWLAQLMGMRALRDSEFSLLSGSLLVNVGTAHQRAGETQLIGLVAEALWLDVTADVNEGHGLPVVLEGHQWSATDPGGDGLAIYRTSGALSFCLWESKGHGTQVAVRGTVTDAAKQLRLRGSDYLGRFVPVAQRVSSNEELADFICRLPELWANGQPESNVGVSVTAGIECERGGCFEKLHESFDLEPGHHYGRLHLTGDVGDFAAAVRHQLWKGCGLCEEQ